MKIYIKQKGTKYFVYQGKDQPPILTGFWESRWRSPVHSRFFDNRQNEVLHISNGKLPLIGSPKSYFIKFTEQNFAIEVNSINFWRTHFQCKLNNERYDYYEHHGHKKSLYRNGKQVARLDKVNFNWGENDSGFALYDSDVDFKLVLALWIMKDMGEVNGADVTLDFGTLWGVVKEWDDRWTPTNFGQNHSNNRSSELGNESF